MLRAWLEESPRDASDIKIPAVRPVAVSMRLTETVHDAMHHACLAPCSAEVSYGLTQSYTQAVLSLGWSVAKLQIYAGP